MILVLGGTTEGRRLAESLAEAGHRVVLSLGGVTRRPVLPPGVEVRVGGFGGVAGLCEYLADEGVRVLVDATHPFAEQMTRNAVQACALQGTPMLRLDRPGWSDHPDADRWLWVPGHREAAEAARDAGRRILLTVGRQHTLDYAEALGDRFVLARIAEAPAEGWQLPASWVVEEARGPFPLADETELMRRHGIEVLVTKDAGGTATRAKLDAARVQGVQVVMITRPPAPPGVVVVRGPSQALHAVRDGHVCVPEVDETRSSPAT